MTRVIQGNNLTPYRARDISDTSGLTGTSFLILEKGDAQGMLTKARNVKSGTEKTEAIFDTLPLA